MTILSLHNISFFSPLPLSLMRLTMTDESKVRPPGNLCKFFVCVQILNWIKARLFCCRLFGWIYIWQTLPQLTCSHLVFAPFHLPAIAATPLAHLLNNRLPSHLFHRSYSHLFYRSHFILFASFISSNIQSPLPMQISSPLPPHTPSTHQLAAIKPQNESIVHSMCNQRSHQ